VGCPNQNGDVEAAQGVLKRRLNNQLILRGTRDFDSVAHYAGFVADACRGANTLRVARLAEESVLLRALPTGRYPEEEELSVRVSSYSTVRVKGSAYSVPARLIGTYIQAHLSEQTVRLAYRTEQVACYRRSTGKAPRIDYRHIIDSLVRKPGAFARYIYREELFPRPVFRQAFDRFKASDADSANARYLRVLKLAADYSEDRVAACLGAQMRAAQLPDAQEIEKQLERPRQKCSVQMAAFEPRLDGYDELISEVAL